MSTETSAVHKPIFLLARTAPPSAALQSLVAVHGMRLEHCALVQAQPEPMSAALSALLDAASKADWHVFVSPQAVQAARSLRPEIATWAGRFAAVGASTAAALDVANVLVPESGEGAQALLDCPDLQRMAGMVAAIYAAPDGLGLLASTLSQRGACVLLTPVYRRVTSVLNIVQKAQCRAAESAYVGSVAFLDTLLTVRAGKPLLVLAPSERVAAAARALDCTAIVCDGTGEPAIAAQVIRLSHGPR